MKKALLIVSGLAVAGGLGYYFLSIPKLKVIKIDPQNRIVYYSFGDKEGSYNAQTGLATHLSVRGFEMDISVTNSYNNKKMVSFVVTRGTKTVLKAPMNNFGATTAEI